jgi:hypothetical protein
LARGSLSTQIHANVKNEREWLRGTLRRFDAASEEFAFILSIGVHLRSKKLAGGVDGLSPGAPLPIHLDRKDILQYCGNGVGQDFAFL